MNDLIFSYYIDIEHPLFFITMLSMKWNHQIFI